MRLSPGERPGKGTTHACEEFVHVLSGEVTITLEGKTFVLGVGDSAHMDARRLLWGRRRFSCRSTPPNSYLNSFTPPNGVSGRPKP